MLVNGHTARPVAVIIGRRLCVITAALQAFGAVLAEIGAASTRGDIVCNRHRKTTGAVVGTVSERQVTVVAPFGKVGPGQRASHGSRPITIIIGDWQGINTALQLFGRCY
jgi:hypothetical protein